MENDTKATSGNGRIEALRERERQLRLAIAAEQEKQDRRIKRDSEKLGRITGEAAIAYAAASPGFKAELTQMLDSVVTDEKKRRFLQQKGFALK